MYSIAYRLKGSALQQHIVFVVSFFLHPAVLPFPNYLPFPKHCKLFIHIRVGFPRVSFTPWSTRSTTSILRFTYHLIWETHVICPQNSVPIPVRNTVSCNYLCLFLTLSFSSLQTITLLYQYSISTSTVPSYTRHPGDIC